MDQPSTTPAPVSTPKPKQSFTVPVLVALGIIFAVAGGSYWLYEDQFVYTDKALVQAPLIQLTPQSPGILKNVLVNEGDYLKPHEPVARVGLDLVSTEIGGLALMVKNDIGAAYQAGEPVVTMIDPQEMRIVARLEEDKGLKDIFEGQKVIFTVDAYGSQEFEGVVDEVSQVSRSGDVVFNISDKRETQEFEIKIAYDLTANPVFKNGMSAKVWIVKE